MIFKTQFIAAAIFCNILIITSCGSSEESSDQETEEIVSNEEEAAPEIDGITAQDSADVNSIMSELKGIEKFAIRDNYNMLLALLEHKDDGRAELVKTIIEKQNLDYYHTFSIIELDASNGYIQYAPNGAEVTYTMTYWNLNDGGQLIASEAWGCGPICESDLTFQRYENSSYELLENEDIIPELKELPYEILPNYDPKGLDPIEFKYQLPKNGKNIQFCLEDDCVELVFDNGVFKKK